MGAFAIVSGDVRGCGVACRSVRGGAVGAVSATRLSGMRPRSRPGLRDWVLWSNPPVLLGYVLAVDAAAAVVAVLAGTGGTSPTPAQVVTLLLLATGAAVHGQISRRVELAREIAADGVGYADPYAVWTFAGVCLLPTWPALLLVGLVYSYSWWRVNDRPPLHRRIFTVATVLLASTAAGHVVAPGAAQEVLGGRFDAAGLALVVGAVLVYVAVNLGLVVGAVSLAAPSTTWRSRLGRPVDHAYELAALGFAVALAVLGHVACWLLPALLVPLFTAHRGMLCTRLVQTIRTDDKTGLATAAYWHAESERCLTRAGRRRVAVGVLMIDLDEFKGVNDTYGHLAGDQVLRAVAAAVRTALAGDDLVGRFGGEEYVALLHDADLAAATTAAERVRRAVAALEVPVEATTGPVVVSALTVSIGVAATDPARRVTATPPGSAGPSLDDLLLAADAELYRAKRTGRNRVCRAL